MAVVDDFFIKIFGWFVINRNDAKNHAIHFFLGSWWACLFRCYSWWKIAMIVYIVYSFVQELFLDGHVSRIIHGTEKKTEFIDMFKDLLTRQIGLAFFVLK